MPRALSAALHTFVVASIVASVGLWLAVPAPTVPVRVRWTAGLAGGERADLESQFSLREGQQAEGTTWAYGLADYSRSNVQQLVEHPAVDDTQGVQRDRFEPDVVPPDRPPILIWALLAGAAMALLAAGLVSLPRQHLGIRTVAPLAVIVGMVTLTYLPVLGSGDRLMFNNDFFLFASRHEAVAQSVQRYRTLPLRSPWLGGGFNTIADPEDPTLNPLVLFSIALGGINGIKAIGYLAMLVGGLATYALARSVLGHTEWGALFSGLVFGTCLFVPSRLTGGNPNELCGAWLPLGLLLIGLALQGRRWPHLVLPLVFYTMISDGKLTALMAMLYIGVLCLLAVHSSSRVFPGSDSARSSMDYRPLTYLAVAVGLTIVIALPRVLPALEVIQSRGGIAAMMAAHPQSYSPEGINAYTFNDLWRGVLGWDRAVSTETLNRDLLTVGLVPAVLCGVALLVFWRQTLPWGIVLLLFAWLVMAHRAPVDLLAALWKLPIFDTIYRPYKYFSFQIAFTIAIVGGYSFHLLRQLHSRRVEALIAAILIAFSIGFLYPRSNAILSGAFTQEPPAVETPAGFFTVVAADGVGRRTPRAIAYFNVRRDIGTLNGFTAVPAPTTVAPRYFVDADDEYVPNPAYRGEAYFLEPGTPGTIAPPVFEPNSMSVSVDVGAAATVIINQHYDRDWHASVGTLSAVDGLIALHLAEPGSYAVRLTYRPRSFYAGLGLAVLALVTLAVVRRRRR